MIDIQLIKQLPTEFIYSILNYDVGQGSIVKGNKSFYSQKAASIALNLLNGYDTRNCLLLMMKLINTFSIIRPKEI